MAAQQIRRTINDLSWIMAMDDEDDSDVEILLLDALDREPRPFQSSFRIDLEALNDKECIDLFRFNKNDLRLLHELLQIPEVYKCPNGTVARGMESLLLILRRLSYPNRLSDLCPLFGRPEPELSMILHEVLDDLYDRFGHLLEILDMNWIDGQTFADAIHAAGASLDKCWGFIDGTLRKCCRPVVNQRILYSGHKRVHGIKFQIVNCPNGMIANLFGPIAGRHHDAFVLAESNLLQNLRRNFPAPNIYYLYGDPAYPIRQHIIGPYRGALVTPQQQQFNSSMSKVRESVEWGFGKIVQYFAFLDFSKNLKILLQPIGKYYVIGALFTNCHTCLYGSTTGSYFDIDPPDLEMYLSG